MTQFLVRRLLVFFLRIGGAAVLLLLLIEVGFGWLREDSIHVWNTPLPTSVPAAVSPMGESPWEFVSRAFFRSVPSLLIAFSGIWMIGYGWGILGARFRWIGIGSILRFPFFIAACFPGFWLVILVALYSYSVWERPGFADEIRVDQGPDLVVWWNAAVVALPLIMVGSFRLSRSVDRVLQTRCRQIDRGAFFMLGDSSETVFYRRIFRPSRKELASLMDQVLPVTLGGLVIVETAFRKDGIGFVFVGGIIEGDIVVVFLSAFLLTLLGSVLVLIREFCVFYLERRAG